MRELSNVSETEGEIFFIFSPSVTTNVVPAFGLGRKHSLLPALAKNMPQAYFLNASRPHQRKAFRCASSKIHF